ncbi:MAG TPA: tripartite tricarboxylate transporter TctB family protein [Candidatus Binatia bacterium]|nr:tripartite tricarboxylate transporter TctB family protein [Candidatus Binatia bacterium]
MAAWNKGDLASGVCVAAFGLYVTVESSRLTYVSEFGPGPGFLPLWLGMGLLGFGLCLIGVSLFRSSRAERNVPGSPAAAGRALGGWLALMVAIALLPWLGFSFILALLSAFLILALERRSFLTAVSVAFGLAFGFQVIFALALGLSLPSGPWGF